MSAPQALCQPGRVHARLGERVPLPASRDFIDRTAAPTGRTEWGAPGRAGILEMAAELLRFGIAFGIPESWLGQQERMSLEKVQKRL